MIDDEDAPKPAPFHQKLDLTPLSIEELESYIEWLRAEIARAEADIEAKRSQRGAADQLFGPKA